MSGSALTARELGKRYGRRWALRQCTLTLPRGGVIGLVGANGAGKTTLLHLAVGLLPPSEGSIEVLDVAPGAGPDALARIGFLAQDAPLYGSLTVGEHLCLGARLNPTWDLDLASSRIAGLGLDPRQRAGRLSGGQRSQLALTLAIAKRPDVLVLDEPVASLDPLARRELLGDVMELVADRGPTVIMSSHSLADVERVCDHIVVLADGRVRVDGPVDELLATHKLLTGGRRTLTSLPDDQEVIEARQSERQTTVLVRTNGPIHDPHWVVSDIGLEELVVAYMSAPSPTPEGPRLMKVGA